MKQDGGSALAAAEAWVTREPANAQAWVQLGHVLLVLEQRQPAARVLEKALKLDPQLITAQVGLAAAFLAQGQDKRAMALLQQALQGDQLTEPMWLLAVHYLVQAQIRLEMLDAARQTLIEVEDRIQRRAVKLQGQLVAPAWLEKIQWQLMPCWWQTHEARRIRIRRPQAQDALWLKTCFADDRFANSVNREYAKRVNQIPVSLLAQQLEKQFKQSPVDQGAVLWLIERIDSDGSPVIGLAGLVNIDANNRRAEFMMGYPGNVPLGTLVMEAGVLLADVVFGQLCFHKLTASIYEDNPRCADVMSILLRLGFQCEGVHREQVRVQDRFLDLHVLGALHREVLAVPGLQKSAKRFLSRVIKASTF